MPEKKSIDSIKEAFAAFDGLASFYYILQKASDVNRFLNWLQIHHCINPTDEILAGYKLLLGSIFKCFMEEINAKTALQLTSDETLYRAQFTGIPLADLPNTCEKTVLIKRVWLHERAIFGSKTWKEINEKTTKMKEDLDIFRRLFEEYCQTKVSFDKQYVIQSIASDHIFTYLNDTHRGFPLAEATFPPDRRKTTEQYLTAAFPGYVYGLQFLWYSVLGKEEFNRTCVKDLHLSLNEEENKRYQKPKNPIEELINEGLGFGFKVEPVEKKGELDEEAKDFVEAIKRDQLPRSHRWESLDRFYRQIQTQIVTPREKKLGVLGISHLLLLKNYNKSLLNELLDIDKVPRPDYLAKKDSDSIKKQLEAAMLWYDVNVLDTQLSVFNGVPAFAPTLLGSVELSKAFHNNEPVKALVFKHPTEEKNKFDYSFGLLIEAVTSLGISDYSGWLIFFDCATDYSGFGGSLLDFARVVMQSAQKTGHISVKEIIVDKELFIEYLKDHSVSSVFDTLIKGTPVGTKKIGSLTAIQNEMQDFLGKAKGKLLEHVVCKWLKEAQGIAKTNCDVIINGTQVDCIGENDKTFLLFECKLNMHKDKVDETIKQIHFKCQALSKMNKKVEPWLVVYEMISSDTKKDFEKSGIFVQDNFRSVIAEHRCFDGTRVETLKILDWQFHSQKR